MPVIKVCNNDRSIRKKVKVTDHKLLLNAGEEKLGYDPEELKDTLVIKTFSKIFFHKMMYFR